jgi:cysteine desulfurase
MIYFDNNATTNIDPTALDAMLPFLRDVYGNPSSAYGFSRGVKRALTSAREQTAALLGCETEEIVFTGGGTESDNAAIFSATQVFPDRKHIVTVATEHDAVLVYCDWLEKFHGYTITRLGVDKAGRLDVAELDASIRPNETALVSVMWSNNETGVLGPVKEASEAAAAKGVLFHCDAVQAGGKVMFNLRGREVHYLSLSGHKFHAPKGVGVLYVNRKVRFRPWMLGGGQENHRRAGTENVAGIVALGQAAEAARLHLEKHGVQNDPVRKLRDTFESELSRRIPDARINGHPKLRTPNTSNVRIPGADAQGLIILLDQKGICASAGSACHTGALHPSRVLGAMGCSAEEARECLRFSFSRFNTMTEINTAIPLLEEAAQKLRSMKHPD